MAWVVLESRLGSTCEAKVRIVRYRALVFGKRHLLSLYGLKYLKRFGICVVCCGYLIL